VGGTASLTTPLPITSGGTGANTAAGARTALGIVLPTSGQYDPTFTTTSGSVTLAGGGRTLYWQRVGEQVTLVGNLFVGSVSSPSGSLNVSLPFPTAHDFGGSVFYRDQSAGQQFAFPFSCFASGGGLMGFSSEFRNANLLGANDQFVFSVSYLAEPL
jgi:hypothetical protein